MKISITNELVNELNKICGIDVLTELNSLISDEIITEMKKNPSNNYEITVTPINDGYIVNDLQTLEEIKKWIIEEKCGNPYYDTIPELLYSIYLAGESYGRQMYE